MPWRERWFRRGDAADGTVADPPEPAAAPAYPVLVDAATRTFWSRGASAAATLVETDTHVEAAPQGRVKKLLASHEGGAVASGRPRANPAFSEAFFVELMRAQRYERAYDLLTPSCQREWGSPGRFAAAQAGGGLRHLRGVRVLSTTAVEEWVDPETAEVFEHATALEAEYTVDNGRERRVIRRQVHLVGVAGRWRSVIHPPSVSER